MHEGRQRQTKGGEKPVIERLRHDQCTTCSLRFAQLQSFLLTRATARRAAPLPHRRPSALAIAFALCAMWSCESRASSDWPTRPVTIIVPFVAGGNTDMMARLAAERLSAKFGQPFVIENRGGAGGVTGAAQVARSAPDG